MEPNDHVDIDGFDIWLDELARGIVSPAPTDSIDLAEAAIWLRKKGERTMISPSMQRRFDQQFLSMSTGGPSAPRQPITAQSPHTRTSSWTRPTSPRRALVAAVAVLLLALPIVVLAVRSFGSDPEGPSIPAPTNGLAQSGTPIPCNVVQPTTLEISGTPSHDPVLRTNGWAEMPNHSGYSVPALYIGDLPSGPPASAEDIGEIQRALAAFATCLYTRDFISADAFYSDDSFRRSGSNRQDSFRVTITPDPTLAVIPTPTRALDTLTAPIVPVIVRSNMLSDGRVGVLLEEDLSGRGLQEYIILVRSDRGWLIDEEIIVTSTPNPSPEASSLTIAIRAIDLQFQPSRIEITAGVDFTLVITNDGKVNKTFVIPELDIDEQLPAGETISVVVNAPKGVYEFHSDIPNQRAAGMQGLLIVIP